MGTFWKTYAECMARGWQIYGKVMATSGPMLSHSFGQVMARVSRSYDRAMSKFGKVMVKLWQRYGRVYGKAMAELWQRDSGVMVKLCLAPYYSDASNRSRLRRTDAHNIRLYIYIYMMMEVDGLDGYCVENMLVLIVFWMGLGGVGMFFG